MKSSDGIQLRTAGREHMEFLYGLLKTGLGPYVEETYGPWIEVEQRSRFFEASDPEAHQLIELEGRAIGCLLVQWLPDQVKLSRIFLLPEFQNRGIGTRLLHDLVGSARAAGLPVRLQVMHVNPARRLYERLGFAEAGETDTHVLMELVPDPQASSRKT